MSIHKERFFMLFIAATALGLPKYFADQYYLKNLTICIK